jgi:ferredoxin, 2Fe-2S
MPIINYVDSAGTTTSIEASIGSSLMETAVKHGIVGIVAECGGAGLCATCHVYIDDTLFGLIDPPNSNEEEMLEFVAGGRSRTSRLACQIRVRDELAGLKVWVPESQ